MVFMVPHRKFPKIHYHNLENEMIYLPKNIISNIYNLLILQKHASRVLKDILDGVNPYEAKAFFFYRQVFATKIGIKCLLISFRLRKILGLPIYNAFQGKGYPFFTLRRHWHWQRIQHTKGLKGL